jgi:ankyrin repeat protein
MEILINAGGVTKYDVAPVLDLLRGRLELLAEKIEADPQLVHQQFPELDFGSTGARTLKLQGATLLHVAAEYDNVEAAKLLLERGADVNARADANEAGVGGQTPIFHAVTQFFDWGLPVAQLLMERGADLSVRAKVPGHYERPGEVVECTPLGYAMLFPGGENKAVTLLREHGGTQ